MILLREGRVLASGPVDEVMTSAGLGACFEVEVEILTRENGSRAVLV